MPRTLCILLSFTILTSLFGVRGSFGQVNLVPNPSFEIYDTCPNNQNQLQYLQDWDGYTIYSPDYFNSCAPNGNSFSVPYNWGGYQQALTGDGYTGIYTFEATPPYNIREYIGCQLTSSLIVGTKYFVSFNTSLAIDTQYTFTHATNNIGALFSTTQRTIAVPPNYSHIVESSIVTDTSSWTTIEGSFIADSAYQHIIIGNFYDDANTDTLLVADSAYFPWVSAYYLIDDVCVSEDSLTCYLNNGLGQNTSQKGYLVIYPNPFSEQLTIQYPGGTGFIYSLYTITGCMVAAGSSNGAATTIDVQVLPRGLYLLVVQTEEKRFTRKVMIS